MSRGSCFGCCVRGRGFWGAIIVGLVSWLLHLLIGDNRPPDRESPPVRVVRVR